jgi:hypothetical protein
VATNRELLPDFTSSYRWSWDELTNTWYAVKGLSIEENADQYLELSG